MLTPRRVLTPQSAAYLGELVLARLSNASPLMRTAPEDSPWSSEPFWSVVWPGGFAAAKYVLSSLRPDRPHLVRNQSVIDFGSGNGVVAVAAAAAGARAVLATEICADALEVVAWNAELNGVADRVSPKLVDILRLPADDPAVDADILIAGDVLYDADLGVRFLHWAACWQRLSPQHRRVIIGDPGRWSPLLREAVRLGRDACVRDFAPELAAPDAVLDARLQALATYALPPEIRHQNPGYTEAAVFALVA